MIKIKIGYIRVSTTDQNTARQEVLMAELEREYILQRQAEGIAIAKEQGVYKGRKPIVRPEFENVVSLWRQGKITAVEAMSRLDMKASTFYRKVKELKL